MNRLLLLGALALLGCPGDTGETDTDTGNTVVYEGPHLAHTPPTTLEAGVAVPVSVTATDEDGVQGVRVYFRTLGEAAWDVLELTEDPETTWTGTIPGDQVAAPGLQYYFRGQDLSDLQIASYLPEDGQQTPFQIDIPLRGSPVPFTEDFEGLATQSIYDLGWDEEAAGFGGYPWIGNSTRASSGTWSVGHRRGVEGIAALDDWLITPPLDLSSLPEIQVTWQEWGNQASLSNHSLWISLGSPDPADGEFVLVEELAAPVEDEWTRSAVVDLTAWSGQPLAYLAWRYEGQFADDWWIDDVAVEALGPDVRLDDWTAGQVDPGGSTTVTFTLINASPEDSGPFTVTATTDVANGVFADPDEEGSVDALLADTTVDVSFDLTVDAAFPDDSMLPFTLTIDDGVELKTYDLALVVGTLPAATIDVSSGALGLVQGWLGVGDPEDPDVEFAAFSEVFQGTRTYTVDLASQVVNLPPEPGPGRWYLRVSAAMSGSLTGFEIAYDDVLYTGDDLGTWVAGGERIYFLPRPPAPVVASSSTTPTTISPGDSVTWNATLENEGAATVGMTTATVTTDDPNVTITTPDPIQIAASGWAANGFAPISIDMDVATTKIDSQPIRLTVTVTDEVESFTTEATVEVPWPVLHVTGVSFDDTAPGGDGDGLLEPSEQASVLVELTNQGDVQAFGVNCVLSKTGGVVNVTIIDAIGNFGILSVGQSDETTFDIQINGGAVGEDLELTLTCEDASDNTFVTGFEIVLGEEPWIMISPVDDPLGDALDGDIDLVNGRYRSDGTTLDIVFESHTPFAPATLFFESWMIQQGSEFVMYQLVVQGHTSGPTSTIRGCTLYLGGTCYEFGTVTTPTAVVLSSTEVKVSIALADLGLVVDRIDGGFAGGFCGGSALYCDSLPENWGNGITGLLTYRFLPLDVGE